MNENQIIPIPDKSGGSGKQIAGGSTSDFQEANPLEGLPMARAIRGLASTHSRSLGGEVTSALIAGATTQLACDYRELKERHGNLSDRFESQRDELEKTRIRKAILIERIKSEGRNKHLKNLSITIGTSLIGTGIFLSRTGLDEYSYGAYGFGAVLLILGWFSGPKEVEE
ncbi:MAG: hypothetical protein A3J94_00625 [Syntrophus sp. RIFOXYC2_FULL_54_9]|nr:MAG: hypothetical protein A3J94_00625 [Syntrophus sp. RIFOXYC2_FULL_54_9]